MSSQIVVIYFNQPASRPVFTTGLGLAMMVEKGFIARNPFANMIRHRHLPFGGGFFG